MGSMQLLARLAVLAAPVLALSAEPGSARPLVIGLSLPDASYPVFADAKRAAEAEAAALGVKVEFRSGGFLTDTQALAIERLVEQGVSGIIVSPLHTGSIAEAIDGAVAAGVPVVKVLTGPGGDRALATLTPDARLGGRMAARYVIARLRDRGTVVELVALGRFQEAFRAGFERELAASHVKLVIAEPTDLQRGRARQTVGALLAQRAAFDAVVAVNDPMALGAADALRAAGIDPASRVIVGWDALPEARRAVEAGVLAATFDPRPDELARRAVRLLVYHLRTGNPPHAKEILVAPELVTRTPEEAGTGAAQGL